MAAYKILWAIHPFEENKAGQKRAIELIELLAKKQQVVVQPVHIVSPEAIHWAGKVPLSSLKEISENALLEVEKITEKVKKARVHLPHLLYNTEVSTERDVKKLVGYAKKHNFDAILCNSHNKSNFETFFFGSFTETLLMKSSVPCLIVQPQSKAIQKLDKILYPTDLLQKDNKVAFHLAKFCKNFNTKLELFHKVASPIDPLVQNGSYMLGGGWISVGEFFQSDFDAKLRKLSKMKEHFKSKGVSVVGNIVTEADSVAFCVNKYAKKSKCDLVAVSTRAKSKTSFKLGSISKNIMQTSDLPIWMFHA